MSWILVTIFGAEALALLALAMAVDIPLLVLTWMEINGILASSPILGHTSLTTLP